ncbi:hypothetical protein BJ741DRAFT_637367 [Chytriomyces cf. hyalinus JEL632]|nr:hypothetical protein BJ741DRAFT_637367 [Chytriomyces cf. hyalinus JEL632]
MEIKMYMLLQCIVVAGGSKADGDVYHFALTQLSLVKASNSCVILQVDAGIQLGRFFMLWGCVECALFGVSVV